MRRVMIFSNDSVAGMNLKWNFAHLSIHSILIQQAASLSIIAFSLIQSSKIQSKIHLILFGEGYACIYCGIFRAPNNWKIWWLSLSCSIMNMTSSHEIRAPPIYYSFSFECNLVETLNPRRFWFIDPGRFECIHIYYIFGIYDKFIYPD